MSDAQIKRSGFIGATIGNAWEGLRDAVSGVKPTRSKMMEYDQPLLWVSIVLLGLGLVMVYSASIALPDSPKYANYTNGHFLLRHAFSLLIGVIGAVVAFQIPVKFWDKYAPKLFIIALVLLVVVLIPHVGKGVNGARRWLPLGVMNFQPSELMKLAVVLYAANYTVRKQDWMQNVRKGFLPMGVAVAFVGSLLLLEPDMGAFLVIAAVAMGILFLGGVNGKLFGGLVLTAVSTFSLLILMSPWRRERIFAYLNPWQEEYAQGKAYQLTHSLIAFGRGEWTGVGLGGSIEKLHYLPEAHTDFILAVIGEELGFVGVLIVILLFYWMVRRAFEIGRTALQLDRTFAGLVAKGLGIWIGWQAFINMGVNLGLLPTKGLTLPMVSYGGSGILMNCMAIALLLRIDYENRVLMRGGRYDGTRVGRSAAHPPRHGRRHRRPHLPRAVGGQAAGRARVAGGVARQRERHGRPARAQARFPAGVGAFWRRARQGPRHQVPAAAEPAACVLAEPGRGAPRASERGAGHGRLHHLSGRHDERAAGRAAGAARTEFDRGPGQSRARTRGRSRAVRLSGCAARRRVGRQSHPCRSGGAAVAAGALCRAERSAAGAGRGGSLGAAALNDVVPRALALLPADTRPIVIHQAGAKQIDTLRANYAAVGIDETHAQAVPFIDDMAAAYAQADLVICRAGAMTVSEVAAAGVAALFVPFPHAVDDHQTTNARFLSERGAALLVPQPSLGPASLADTLASLTRAQLADMAAKAREQARPEAAERVADICVAAARA